MHRAKVLQVSSFGGLNLGPVASYEHETSDEGSKNLREDIMGDFLPREALPNGKADRD